MNAYLSDQKHEIMKLRTFQTLIHISLWFVLSGIYLNYNLRTDEAESAVYYTLYSIFISAIPFYWNYFLISKLLFVHRSYISFSLAILGTLAIPVIIIKFTPWAVWIADTQSYSVLFDGTSNVALFLILSTAVRGMETFLYNRHIEAEREKEKLLAELNFLKIQINPHFLFNTLNNIYSLAYNGDKKAAKMIAKLSHILRYMLYDCKEERVPLQKEYELLENFIGLNSFKYGKELNIDLYVEGMNLNMHIAPLILITFLENSFKHSKIGSVQNGWIKIGLIIEDESLIFTIANSVATDIIDKPSDSGLGLKNIRQQLELIYGKEYSLQLKNRVADYEVTLTIPINGGTNGV